MNKNNYNDWADEEINRLQNEVRDLENQVIAAHNEIRRLHHVIRNMSAHPVDDQFNGDKGGI